MSSAPLAAASSASARIRLPLPSGLIAGLGLLTALALGLLIGIDARLGIGALAAATFTPIVFLSLPLGVILWVPLVFINAVPFVSLVSLGVLALIAIGWLGVLANQRAFLVALARRHALLSWTLVLLVAWVTASIAWSSDPAEAAGNAWNWYVAMAGFAVVATTISRPKHLVWLMMALVVGAILAASVGYAPIGGDTPTVDQDGRLSGGLGDPNFLAAGLVVSFALAAGLAMLTRNSGLRWTLLVVMLYLLVSLAATGSRGGLIAAAISIVASLVLVPSAKVRLGTIVITALALAGLWVGANSSGTWDRIREFDTRGTGRVDLWDIAWRMSQDHFVIGVGVDSFRAESNNYVRQPGSPEDVELITERPHVVHNIYLQQLVETGVIGLALLVAALAIGLRTLWGAIRRLEAIESLRLAGLGRAILVALIGALSASLFLSNAYDPLLWILIGMSVSLSTIALRAESRLGSPA